MVRTFRIRTRHEAARLVLAADRIPAEFRYPLDRPDCPLWGAAQCVHYSATERPRPVAVVSET